MPPKAKITAEMIIEAAFAIVRQQGADALNARTIAQQLGCSTQPVLYQFATVEDVRKATYDYSNVFHTQYLMSGMEESEMPLMNLGLNYIRFAATEGNLFRFLFQSAGLGSGSLLSQLDHPDIAPMLEILQQAIGATPEAAKDVFLQLFLVIHGYASLLANNPMPYDEQETVTLLDKALYGACAAATAPKEE